MKSITRLGTRPLRTTIILLSILALAIPFAVFADELVAGGDDLVGNNLNLGNICLDSTGSGTVNLAIERSQGGANQFRNGSTVTVGVINVTGTGLNTDSSSVGTIAIPSDWDSQPGGSKTSAVTSSITIEPTTLGTFSGSVSYRAEGVNQAQGNALVRNASINITANVVDCAPSITETELDVDPATGTYGGETDLSATLTASGSGVEGKSVDFLLSGDPVGSADTDSDGVATLSNVSIAGFSATAHLGAVEASFAGDGTFAPSGGAADLTVSKAIPVVTWSDPADITFGTALGNDQLNASADVEGEFTYSPDTGTVLDPGTHTLSTDFTPDDAGNYNSVENTTVSINVTKAAGSVSIDNIPTEAVFGGSFTPTYSTTSDGTPSVASLTQDVCSVEDGDVSFDAAGECTLQVSITEGTHHQAATGEPQSFAIGQAEATIELSNLQHTFDGDPKSATAITDPAGLSGVTITYDGDIDPPVNAGSYDVIASLSNPNYQASDATGTLVIAPKAVTGSFTAENKTYDGTTDATVASTDLSGIVDGDDVHLDVSNAHFEDKNAGTDKTVTANLALSGDDAVNYVLSANSASTTADITPLEVTGSFTANNKVYDGSADATVAGSFVTPDFIGDDEAMLEISNVRFEDKNVGDDKTVNADLALAGEHSFNYVLSAGTASTTADISPREVTGSFTAASKVYDGDDSAEITGRYLSGAIEDDEVELVGGAASFEDKNAGTGKTVTGVEFSLDGADAGNYTLESTTLTTTADIDPLTITGSFTVADKVYDGNDSASITGRSLSGVIGEDDVELVGGTATFDNKNVGTDKTVSGSDFSLSGNDKDNYTLSMDMATAAITARTLNVSGTGVNKVYDGNDNASVTLSDDRVAGDDVEISYTSASFEDKNVGMGKTVTVSGIAINGGDDLGNYELGSTSANTMANITALEIDGSFAAADKVYDGNADATITGRYLTGVIGEDDVSLVGGAATFNNENVGANKTVTGTGFSLSGNDKDNYSLASSTLTTTASITSWNAAGHGFYQPVGTANSVFVAAPGGVPLPNGDTVWNTVKGSQTVPLKFNVFADGVEKTSTSDIAGYSVVKVNGFSSGSEITTTDVEFTTAGNTSLRYDTKDGQFIQNWKTPKVNQDTHYRATITFADGSSLSAFFILRK